MSGRGSRADQRPATERSSRRRAHRGGGGAGGGAADPLAGDMTFTYGSTTVPIPLTEYGFYDVFGSEAAWTSAGGSVAIAATGDEVPKFSMA
ncbi:MAG: hypothetical protein H0W70_11095, partial [Actinobacteria bacterium]|nr:hypothetical protein [Actinomycetota bacterium]